MEILDYIDRLEDLAKTAKQPLLSKDQIILDENEVYEIIDGLRTNLPLAIQDAQWVKKDEARIIAAAQEEHDKIIDAAKARAQRLIEEDEITRRAVAEAENIVNQAQLQAHEITEGAFVYAHDIMEKLENQLTVYYEVVQEGREEIQGTLNSLNNQTLPSVEVHDED